MQSGNTIGTYMFFTIIVKSLVIGTMGCNYYTPYFRSPMIDQLFYIFLVNHGLAWSVPN